MRLSHTDSLDRIVSATSEYFGVPVSAIMGESHKAEIVRARRVAIFLCSKLTNTRHRELSRYFGKSASSILRSVETAGSLIDKVEFSNITEILRRDTDPAQVLESKGEEEWRILGARERRSFGSWVEGHLNKRRSKGLSKYGERFQGDPVEHLIEELVDALLYAWVIERRYKGA